MRHIRRGMKQTMNSVAAVATHHAETMRLRMFLYNITDLSVLFTRFHNVDSLG